MQFEAVHQAVNAIRFHLPENFTPRLGIILGTGLGQLGEQIEQLANIPYQEIPGFYVSTVPGHAGRLLAGYWQGVPVICFQGRVHFYEGAPVEAMRMMIYSLKFLGCETLLLTNAAGSLHLDMPPGSLMLIKDHINLQGISPLQGLNDERIGQRFVALDEVYNLTLREELKSLALDLKIPLTEGVYLSVLGPHFETPAEIKAFRILGADAVGMSTVPEAILAKHCGLKVLAISVITNLAAGLSAGILTHEEHIAVGRESSAKLINLLKSFVGKLK